MPSTPPESAPVPLAREQYHSQRSPVNPRAQHSHDHGTQPPLGRLSYSHKRTTKQSLTIARGGSYAKLRFHRQPEKTGERHWKRGQVHAFSMRSRSRLLQSFAKADFRNYQGALFVTLTYHHEWSEVGPEWKQDIKEWERRIRRRYPHAWCYWRLELQKRGAPHFHCLVFGLDESAKPMLKQTWLDVAEACCKWCHLYMARVDKLKSWEQVRSYCSKYSAKYEKLAPEFPGRYWGIMNRSQRTERLITVDVTTDEAFKLRRIFKRLIRAANGYYRLGGSRSGVWVSCGEQTTKRALEWVSSAPESILSPPCRDAPETPYGPGTPPADSVPSTILSHPFALPSRTARTTGKSNMPLFDVHDLAAARARRLLAG